MKKIISLVLFFCSAILADTYVAVVETVAEKGSVGKSEILFLTDKLRDCARKSLPAYMGYVIMTRENIQEMLPPGKNIEDCEGTCLVETAKNISADYIAQARIGRFEKQLSLTIEMYETRKGNLINSYTAISKNASGLLKELEKNAGSFFELVKKTDEGSLHPNRLENNGIPNDKLTSPTSNESISLLNDASIDPLMSVYLERVRQIVMGNFNPPANLNIPKGTKAVVHFAVDRFGSISDVELKQPSGNKTWDHLSVRALQISKLPELPPNYKTPSLRLLIPFFAN